MRHLLKSHHTSIGCMRCSTCARDDDQSVRKGKPTALVAGVLQEILNVTDRVQSVSSFAVAPCAQQLLACNK